MVSEDIIGQDVMLNNPACSLKVIVILGRRYYCCLCFAGEKTET